MLPAAQPWAAIVPVKRLAAAKTRLAVPSRLRADLALAMATDTVTACLGTAAISLVVVVTDEPVAAEALGGLGAVVVADEPDAGLNPALRHGAEHAAGLQPGVRVVALSSDLPALPARGLDELLALVTDGTGFVADASGTGTTLLASADARRFRPMFGARSAHEHRRAGARDLSAVADPGLRRDVDTVDDLVEAAALGVGAATTALLGSHRGLVAPLQ
jgi:2-phospho-L-lactate guanylyltransferase